MARSRYYKGYWHPPILGLARILFIVFAPFLFLITPDSPLTVRGMWQRLLEFSIFLLFWNSITAFTALLLRRVNTSRFAKFGKVLLLGISAIVLLTLLASYRQFITSEEFSLLVAALGLGSFRLRPATGTPRLELVALVATAVSQVLLISLSFRLITLEWAWQSVVSSVALVAMLFACDFIMAIERKPDLSCKSYARIVMLLIVSAPFLVLCLYYFRALPRNYAAIVVMYFFARPILRDLNESIKANKLLPEVWPQTRALALLFFVVLFILKMISGSVGKA